MSGGRDGQGVTKRVGRAKTSLSAQAEGGDSSGRGGASGGKAVTRVIRSGTWRIGTAAKLKSSGVRDSY